MYVCVNACVIVCMYICMYVCVNVCVNVCMYICMYVWMYVWMYVCVFTHVCMYVRMYEYMYLYMYVCMYVYIFSMQEEMWKPKRPVCTACHPSAGYRTTRQLSNDIRPSVQLTSRSAYFSCCFVPFLQLWSFYFIVCFLFRSSELAIRSEAPRDAEVPVRYLTSI